MYKDIHGDKLRAELWYTDGMAFMQIEYCEIPGRNCGSVYSWRGIRLASISRPEISIFNVVYLHGSDEDADHEICKLHCTEVYFKKICRALEAFSKNKKVIKKYKGLVDKD